MRWRFAAHRSLVLKSTLCTLRNPCEEIHRIDAERFESPRADRFQAGARYPTSLTSVPCRLVYESLLFESNKPISSTISKYIRAVPRQSPGHAHHDLFNFVQVLHTCYPWTLLFPSEFLVSGSQRLWIIKILRFHRTLQHKIIFISAAIRWIINGRIFKKRVGWWITKILVKPSGYFVTSWPFLDAVAFQIFPVFNTFIFLLKDVSCML